MKPAVALLAALLCTGAGWAQRDYSGPRPPKPDLPYLLHADNLVSTEVTEAKEEQRKGDSTYTIAGASSSARTPLAEPVFLFESGKIPPESLELYRLEVKNGVRQVTMSPKRRRDTRPVRLSLKRLADRLYRIEVDEGLGLENGEYSLSPAGSNQAFCFTVY